MRNISWIYLSDVMADKDNGSLGVNCMETQNIAFCGKCWQRLKTNRETLWNWVIFSIHGGSGNANYDIFFQGADISKTVFDTSTKLQGK